MHASTQLRRVRVAATIAAIGLLGGSASASATTPPTDTTGGTDAAGTAPADTGAETTDTAAVEPTAIELTVSPEGIEGLPDDLAAGLVSVTVSGADEVEFTRVEPGTDPATFGEAILPIFDGGPIPDFFLNNTGIIGGSGVTALDEGEYIVWADLTAPDAETTAADIVTAGLTVGAGDDEAVVPPGDINVKGGDYLFDLDIVAGGETATFTNTSDNQLHHVVIVDFGTNDPDVVEDKLPEIMSSDPSGPPPEGIDMSQVNFEFGGSGVQGPGSAATFPAPDFQAGNTYVALCFISDRAGGAPHAIQHQMYKVFTIDA